MSLPFISSAFARNARSVSCKRVQCKGQGIGSAAALRRSLDAGRPNNNKRTSAHLNAYDEEFEAQLQPDTAPESAGGGHDASQHDTRLKVGVLGLGSVGAKVAYCLSAKPGVIDLAVYNRNPQPTEPFRHIQGVHVKSSAAEVCAWSDVVIVCMSSYKATAKVLSGAAGLRHLHGRVMVNLTHGTPQEANDAAVDAVLAGVNYLDGCLLGSAADLGKPGMCIVASGSRFAWDRCELVLKTVAPQAFWCGEQPAVANAANVALFSFMAFAYSGYSHAMAVGQRFGIAPHVLPALVTGGMLPLLGTLIEKGEAPFAAPTPAPSAASSQGSSPDSAAVVMGSSKWVQELQECRKVSADAGLSTAVLDGLLAWAHERSHGPSASHAHLSADSLPRRESSSALMLDCACAGMDCEDRRDSTPFSADDMRVLYPGAEALVQASAPAAALSGDYSDELIAGTIKQMELEHMQGSPASDELSSLFDFLPDLIDECAIA